MAISDFLTPEQANQLLDQQFNSPQGIARLNPLAFKYQNAIYPYEDFIGAYSQIDPNAPMYEDFSKPQPDFINAPQNDYASLYSLPELDTSRFKGMNTSYGVANEEDVEQVDSLTGEKKFNVLDLLSNFIPGKGIGSFLAGILPKESPEVRATKDFYAKNYGVNSAGSVASGIMQGYNPVSGGFLNMITGGRYGKPMQVGLANAARRRIENIVNRRAPQTEASRAKIAELQRIAERDTITRARAAAPDVYRDAGDKGRLGPSGGFSTSGKEGAFSSKSGRGRQDF